MDSESIRFLFESVSGQIDGIRGELSNQINTLRGEMKEDLSGVKYDLNKFIQAQEHKNSAQILEMGRRKNFENKLLGAFALFIIVVEIGAAILPIVYK